MKVLITLCAMMFLASLSEAQITYSFWSDGSDMGREALIANEPVGDYQLFLASEVVPELLGAGGDVFVEDGWGEDGEPIYLPTFPREAYWHGRIFTVSNRLETRYLGSIITSGAKKIEIRTLDGQRIEMDFSDGWQSYGGPDDWVVSRSFRTNTEGIPEWGEIEITPVHVRYDVDSMQVTVSRDLMEVVSQDLSREYIDDIRFALDMADISNWPDLITTHPTVEVLDEIMTQWSQEQDSLDILIGELIDLADFRLGEIERLEDALQEAEDMLQQQLEPLQSRIAQLEAELEERSIRDALRVERIRRALGRN